MYTYNNKRPIYQPQINIAPNNADIAEFKKKVSSLDQSDLQALAAIARKQGISEATIIDGLDFINKL